MYTVKINNDLVQVINLKTGSIVSGINIKPYGGIIHSYVNGEEIVVACKDGKTRVFKPSGTMKHSF